MGFGRQQYERAAEQFFRQHPKEFEKYFSPNLLQTVVGALQSSLPTVTAARIAFDRLVSSGELQRTDGRTERDDLHENVAHAEANFNNTVAKVAAAPLTKSELELFASLSNKDLVDRYWEHDGNNEFRVRYDRAVREHFFRIPARPVQAPDTQNDGEVKLTAAEYHSLSAREVQLRLRNPKFKFAVMQLIKSGAI